MTDLHLSNPIASNTWRDRRHTPGHRRPLPQTFALPPLPVLVRRGIRRCSGMQTQDGGRKSKDTKVIGDPAVPMASSSNCFLRSPSGECVEKRTRLRM
jgi:hypothetical protein